MTARDTILLNIVNIILTQLTKKSQYQPRRIVFWLNGYCLKYPIDREYEYEKTIFEYIETWYNLLNRNPTLELKSILEFN